MTEYEATNTLISLTREYMKHTPEERKILYESYKQDRNKVKEALISFLLEQKQEESKIK